MLARRLARRGGTLDSAVLAFRGARRRGLRRARPDCPHRPLGLDRRRAVGSHRALPVAGMAALPAVCALGTPVTVACTPLRAQLWLNLMPTSPKRIRPTTPSGVFLLMLRDGANLSGKGLPRMKGRTLSMPCIVFSTGGKFRRSSVPAEMVRSQRPGVLCTRACLTLGKNVSIRCNGICICVSVTTCTRI